MHYLYMIYNLYIFTKTIENDNQEISFFAKKTCIPYDVSRTYSRGNKMEKFEIIEKLENEWHHIVNEASKMSQLDIRNVMIGFFGSVDEVDLVMEEAIF